MHREAETWLLEHGREIGIAGTSCNIFEADADRLWDESHQNSLPAAHGKRMAGLCSVYGK